MARLKAELEERDRDLRAKQNEVTELNLQLLSNQQKVGESDSPERVVDIDISQHPEYKRLSEEVSKMMEELQKTNTMHSLLQDDYKTSAKKAKALMTQLLDAEELNQQMSGRLAKAEKTIDKLR